jgi:hypothetical protein
MTHLFTPIREVSYENASSRDWVISPFLSFPNTIEKKIGYTPMWFYYGLFLVIDVIFVETTYSPEDSRSTKTIVMVVPYIDHLS